MKRGVFVAICIVYVAFGLYFLRDKLISAELPEKLLNADPWILLFGGLLLIVGGFKFLISKTNSKSQPRYILNPKHR